MDRALNTLLVSQNIHNGREEKRKVAWRWQRATDPENPPNRLVFPSNGCDCRTIKTKKKKENTFRIYTRISVWLWR